MLSFRSLAVFSGALFIASSVQAAQVNFSASHYDMGTVQIGQYGDISTTPKSVNSLSGTDYGYAFGYLPADSEITFDYTITSNSGRKPIAFGSNAELYAAGTYDFTRQHVEYKGKSIAETPGNITTRGEIVRHGHSFVSTPLVLASAHIISSTSGTTTIVNNSSSKASFVSALEIFSKFCGCLAVTYDVSAVPLPGALSMFALALAMLAAFGYRQKRA